MARAVVVSVLFLQLRTADTGSDPCWIEMGVELMMGMYGGGEKRNSWLRSSGLFNSGVDFPCAVGADRLCTNGGYESVKGREVSCVGAGDLSVVFCLCGIGEENRSVLILVMLCQSE
jgi:hypothetical protein